MEETKQIGIGEGKVPPERGHCSWDLSGKKEPAWTATWEKIIPSRGSSKSKGPGAGTYLAFSRKRSKPVWQSLVREEKAVGRSQGHGGTSRVRCSYSVW